MRKQLLYPPGVKMNLRKRMSLVYLSIFFMIILVTTSCKEGLSEPHLNVFTTDNIKKLQLAADNIIMENQTPGLMAYIKVDGEGELFITRGVGNLTTNEPMNPNNFFRIADITKTFTTEAVLMLADEGKIDLNKTISFYLPEYNLPGKDQITIRMLGNMTSGLTDYLTDASLIAAYNNSKGTRIFTAEELITPLLKSTLKFTPGSKFDFCNSNIVLLGMVITKVTGKPLKNVLDEKIYKPFGLTHTFWPETNYLQSPYHHAYEIDSNSPTDVTYYGNSIGNAAGILISSFDDLIIWAKVLCTGDLLSDNAKSERFKFGSSDYGFGISRRGNWIGHSGMIPGWNTKVYYHTVKNISLIIHTNSGSNEPAEKAFQEFDKILSAQ